MVEFSKLLSKLSVDSPDGSSQYSSLRRLILGSVLAVSCLLLIVYSSLVATADASLVSTQFTSSATEFKTLADYQRADRNYKRLGVLLMNAPPGYPNWGAFSVENKYNYTRKHGYGFYVENGSLDPSRPAPWSKIRALITHMKENRHEWFWSIDMDAFVTNNSIEATSFLDDQYDFIISKDINVINSGSFFIKSSPWALDFLERVWLLDKATPLGWWENAAIVQLFDNKTGPDFPHLKVVPQSLINAYYDAGQGAPGTSWKKGDFICHFVSTIKQHIPAMIEVMKKWNDTYHDLPPVTPANPAF
eukprot:jgi/Hompol1/2940/HPOL_006240-RA